MIGKIVGIYSGYYNNTAIIDVISNECCIGYEIIMKNTDILSLNIGEKITIFVKEIIKEDDDALYGFLDFEEKCCFEELIKLNGLGPKIALSILSTYNYEAITNAILSNNCDFFASISGIGTKLANRIPNEMAKNIEKITEKVLNFGIIKNTAQWQQSQPRSLLNVEDNNHITTKMTKKKQSVNATDTNKSIIDDAVQALISLGFSKQSVYNEVFNIVKNNNNISTENIVKIFLKKENK